MTGAETLTAEATGETVGEAKWAALRELERRHPGLDKSAVQFEVIAEGERGILGVGYEPARVIAHLPAEAAEAAAVAAGEEGGQVAEARTLLARIVSALGVDADIEAREEPEAIVVTCSGPDVGLLIGRHGQTIDSIQYLLNAIGWRAYGEERKEVVVDAEGYRARRAEALQRLADQAADDARRQGRPVALDVMTASERKLVHEYLRDRGDVETYSEGEEPDRHLIVAPRSG